MSKATVTKTRRIPLLIARLLCLAVGVWWKKGDRTKALNRLRKIPMSRDMLEELCRAIVQRNPHPYRSEAYNAWEHPLWERPEISEARANLIAQGRLKDDRRGREHRGPVMELRRVLEARLMEKPFTLDRLLWMYMRYGTKRPPVTQWIEAEIKARLADRGDFGSYHRAYKYIMRDGWQRKPNGWIDFEASERAGITLIKQDRDRGLPKFLVSKMVETVRFPHELIALHRISPTAINAAERLYACIERRRSPHPGS